MIGSVAAVSGLSVLVPSYFPLKNPGFSISTTSPLQVLPGSSQTYTGTVTSHDGFAGLVNLAATVPNAPSSLKVTVSPQTVTLSPGGSAMVIITVTTTPSTPAGSYSVILQQTSGQLSRTDTVSLGVVGIAVSADPSSISFPLNATGRSTITVSSVNGYSGQVNLFAFISASGPIATLTPNTITLANGQVTTSTLTVESPAQGSFDVTVNAIANQFRVSDTTSQFYQLVPIPVTVTSTTSSGDFNITTIPSSISMNPGTNQNIIIKLTSLNGCACLVTLSAFGNFLGGVALGPNVVALPAGGTANSTMTLYAVAEGNFTITVTGTSLILSHSAQAFIRVKSVASFSVNANPISFQVPKGSSGSTTITVQSMGGFTGNVSLAAFIGPQNGNLTFRFNPQIVFVPANGVGTSNFTVTAASGGTFLPGYNFTVTGSSGTLFTQVVGGFAVVPFASINVSLTASGNHEPPLSGINSYGEIVATVLLLTGSIVLGLSRRAGISRFETEESHPLPRKRSFLGSAIECSAWAS